MVAGWICAVPPAGDPSPRQRLAPFQPLRVPKQQISPQCNPSMMRELALPSPRALSAARQAHHALLAPLPATPIATPRAAAATSSLGVGDNPGRCAYSLRPVSQGLRPASHPPSSRASPRLASQGARLCGAMECYEGSEHRLGRYLAVTNRSNAEGWHALSREEFAALQAAAPGTSTHSYLLEGISSRYSSGRCLSANELALLRAFDGGISSSFDSSPPPQPRDGTLRFKANSPKGSRFDCARVQGSGSESEELLAELWRASTQSQGKCHKAGAVVSNSTPARMPRLEYQFENLEKAPPLPAVTSSPRAALDEPPPTRLRRHSVHTQGAPPSVGLTIASKQYSSTQEPPQRDRT